FVVATQQPDVALAPGLPMLNFRSSYFTELELNGDILGNTHLLFDDCVIDHLELNLSPAQIAQVTFNKTDIGKLVCTQTVADELKRLGLSESVDVRELFDAENEDVLGTSLPRYLKTVKIVVRKLFRPQVGGRSKLSLYRGIHP